MNNALSGRTVLNTRALKQAPALTALLEAEGATVVCFPCLELQADVDLVSLNGKLAEQGSDDWIVFTSANAVNITARGLSLTGKKIACVGEKTAQALRAVGFRESFVSQTFSGSALATELLEHIGQSAVGRKALLLRGDIAAPELPVLLNQAGMIVKDVAVYRSVLPQPSSAEVAGLRSQIDSIDLALVTSSQAVKNLILLLGDVARQLKVGAIGPGTAQTAVELGFDVVVVAGSVSIESLIENVEKYFAGQR